MIDQLAKILSASLLIGILAKSDFAYTIPAESRSHESCIVVYKIGALFSEYEVKPCSIVNHAKFFLPLFYL
jgi:hypothetical protein